MKERMDGWLKQCNKERNKQWMDEKVKGRKQENRNYGKEVGRMCK